MLEALRYGSGKERYYALMAMAPELKTGLKCFIPFDALEGPTGTAVYKDVHQNLTSSSVDGVFSEFKHKNRMGYGDGIDDGAGFSSLGLNPGTADFSFSVVLQQDPDWAWDSGNHTIIGNRGSGETTSWGLKSGTTNGTLRLACSTIGGSSSAGHDCRNAPTLVNGTFDRDGNMILYVDGISKVTTNISGVAANSMSQTAFTFWKRGVATFDYWGGWMKDFAIWHGVLLSSTQIAKLARLYGV